MIFLDFSYSSERDDKDVEVIKQIKELHSRQNRNILGRLRNDSDWKSLCKSWKEADKNDPRAKFMHYLEDEENENVSRIVAYVVFHIDVGNKHDKVILLISISYSSLFIRRSKNLHHFN